MKTRILLVLLMLISVLQLTAGKGDKPAYRIYNSKGKEANYGDVMKAAVQSNIIFFGELHTSPIAHWLELEMAKDLFAEKGRDLVIGMEMFEADNQLLINEYISKMIRKKDFEAEAKLWPNYKADYAAVVDFARDKGIAVRATNIPRRFAAIVNSKGFEGLDSINAMERGMIAPLPIKYPDTLACYAEIVKSVGEGMPAHLTANLGKAQAMKDATMAHFIVKSGCFDGKTILHLNGTYHTENHEGLVWYMNQAIRKTSYELKILTIACVEQDNIDTISKKDAGKADFVIVVPSAMSGYTPAEPAATKTTPSKDAEGAKKMETPSMKEPAAGTEPPKQEPKK